jgi:hypothetical protein
VLLDFKFHFTIVLIVLVFGILDLMMFSALTQQKDTQIAACLFPALNKLRST